MVCTYYSLVHQVPQETACTTRIAHHQLPIVLQACSVSSVIETVQEFCRHEDLLLAHILGRLAPRTIVLRFESVAVGPRIDNDTLLDVILGKYRFQFIVETTFITVAPEYYRRMIYVARYHFLHNLRTHNGLVCPMPARLFTLHIESQRVAGIQEFWVSRIVAQAHGIHIHRLDE